MLELPRHFRLKQEALPDGLIVVKTRLHLLESYLTAQFDVIRDETAELISRLTVQRNRRREDQERARR